MSGHIVEAYDLGTGRALPGDDEIAAALEAPEPAWLHLRADHPETKPWIERHLGHLDGAVRSALTEPATRPRALSVGGGLLLVLRGINLNEGSDPEDMVSLRIWIDPRQVVSLSRQRVRAVADAAEAVASGAGPRRAGALVARLADRITDRIERHVAELEARVEAVETRVIADPHVDLGAWIADARLEVVELRRFVPPQREALAAGARSGALDEGERLALLEQADQTARVAETVDAVREQILAIQDETERARADRLNHDLYVLSVVSAIFLPLGFLTGLMGINLAGMPGASWDGAFWAFCAILLAVTGVQVALLLMLRRRGRRRGGAAT